MNVRAPSVATDPDLRLLPAAVAGFTAAWWAVSAGSRAVLASAALATVLAAGSLWVGRLHRARGGSGTAGFGGALTVSAAALVLTSTGIRLAEREAGPLPGWTRQRAVATVTGRVTADPHPAASAASFGGRIWVVRLGLRAVTARGATAAGGGPAVVLGGPAWAGVEVGALVRSSGRLQPGRPADPAAAVLVGAHDPAVLSPPAWPWRAAERLRAGLRRACTGLPEDGGGLLPALVAGDTSRLPDRLRTDLRASGLSHLTAVSGANLAIVGAAGALLLPWLGAGRRTRAGGVGLLMAGFVLLARPEPSVLRAAVMGGLGVVGLLLAGREAGIPLLAAATIGLLLADPWLARSVGFVLSVLATAGLLLLVPVWTAGRPLGVPRPLALAVAVPVAAQAVTAPVLVLLQPGVNLLAVPANLLADPAVAPATVAGVAAAALSPCWPSGAHLVATAGAWATGWIALVAHRVATVPGGSLPWPGGPRGALLAAALAAVVVVRSLRRRAPAGLGPPGRSPGDRRTLAAVLALAIALAAGWFGGGRIAARATGAGWPPRDWLVVQCDVGQGAALLLRSGPDRAVLMDAGPEPAPVDRCLRRYGVVRLDLVLLTHFHADHVEGLTGALRGRGRPAILVSPLAEPAAQARRVRALAAAAGCPVTVGTAGLRGQIGSGGWAVGWSLLLPVPGRYPVFGAGASPGTHEPDDGTEVNNASLVIAATVQGLKLVDLGDVERDAQQALLSRLSGVGPVDVVMVAHHGSATQLPAVYRALRPRVATIGVGLGNDYGHPAASTLSMLRATGATVLRTDTQGDLVVAGTAGRLAVGTSGHR